MDFLLFLRMYWLTIITFLAFLLISFRWCYRMLKEPEELSGSKCFSFLILWFISGGLFLGFHGYAFLAEQFFSDKHQLTINNHQVLVIGKLHSEDENKYGIDETYVQIKLAFDWMTSEMARQIPVIVIRERSHFPRTQWGYYDGSHREVLRGTVCIMENLFVPSEDGNGGSLLVWGDRETLWRFAAIQRLRELGRPFQNRWLLVADYEYGDKDIWLDNGWRVWRNSKRRSYFSEPQQGFISARGTESIAADVEEFATAIISLPYQSDLLMMLPSVVVSDQRYQRKMDLLLEGGFITEAQYQKAKELLSAR